MLYEELDEVWSLGEYGWVLGVYEWIADIFGILGVGGVWWSVNQIFLVWEIPKRAVNQSTVINNKNKPAKDLWLDRDIIATYFVD